MEEDESQKIFDPTPRKLEEARKKGDVVKSADVAGLLILAVGAMILLNLGGRISRELMVYSQNFLEKSHEISVDGGALQRLTLDIFWHVGLAMFALMGALSVAAILGHAGQTGLLLAGEKIMPKVDKISPIAGFKRLFGKEALIQFAKILLKVIILGIVAYNVISKHIKGVENLQHLEPIAFGSVLGAILKELLMNLLVVMGIFAGADYFVQRMNFMKRNKMSKHEMKEEYKQTEGDPMIAGKLKQIRMERAKKRMIQNVPKASVIITNPTHFAVALQYEAGVTAAPICVAKGVDRVALKIREVAGEHNIPIIEDPPLARALYKNVEVDEVIPVDYYEAVAKIIGMILNIANRRKSPQNNSQSRAA